MPRKPVSDKETIISAAVEIVRTQGYSALNARALASRLGCSTQPIFSNFRSMEELTQGVLLRALEIYNGFVKSVLESGRYETPYKANGMAYIRFAMEEPNLFSLLFMRDRRDGKTSVEESTFNDILPLIMKTTGLTQEQATLFHLEMWTVVHGIASMAATGYLSLDESLASEVLTDAYQGLIHRFRTKYNPDSHGDLK